MADNRPTLDQIFAQPAPSPAARPSLDQIFAQPPREKASPEASVSMLESGLRGAVQSGTLGFADEISGLVESALTDKTYEQARDESRANFKTAQEANPMTYGAGQVAGGVATAFVPGLNVAKLGSAGARIAGNAGIGALSGVGASEATDLGTLTSDAAVGGLIGGAASGIAESLSPVSKFIAEKSKQRANELAVESLKGSAKQHAKLGDTRTQELGDWLLKKRAVGFGTKAKDSLGRLTGLKKEAGERLGSILDDADAAIPSSAVAERIEQNVMPKAMTTGGESAVAAVKGAISDVGAVEARTLNELNQLGNSIGSKAYNAPTTTAATTAKKSSERAVDELIKEAVPEVQHGALNAANSDFGMAAEAQKMARVGAARYKSSQGFSLGDKLASGVGLGVAGPWGLAAGVANKVVRERGQSAAAVGLDKLSSLLQAAPEAFGSYGPLLKQAADRGSNSLAVQHYLLSQRDPQYREHLEKLQKTSN